ncbi:MAG: A24 family peptidase [Oscillospiraceae bacterium]
MLFTILLLYAAYTDYTRREIPNSVILSMYALSVFSNASVFDKVTELFLLTLPLFFVALKYDGMKGGDVKFLSAAGAYLGLYELSLVLIPTTVTAVLYGYIKSEKSVPLAFVFCIGYIIKAVIFLKGG